MCSKNEAENRGVLEGTVYMRIFARRCDSWTSFGITVTRLACSAHKLACSKILTSMAVLEF